MMAGVQRRVRLDPAPESARLARQAVAKALDEAGCAELVDAATLLVSELVTNAILHARTVVEVSVAATPTGLRVGVNDHNPHLPARRTYGRAATTGRGLEMLELMAADHGIDTHDDGSKTVWFELGTSDAGTRRAVGSRSVPTSAGVDVRLTSTPWRLARAWQQHADALLRESLLACWETGGELDGVLAELNEASEAFAAVAAVLDARASELGAPPSTGLSVDLELSLPATAPVTFRSLGRALETGARLAEEGLFLAPPTQPEMRMFRRWLCDEVAAQASGAQPSPWAGLHPDAVLSSVRPVEWDGSRVSASPEPLVAADDANRILAASPSALALLGWTLDELVGRRIVSLIPARFREAHIAGFTDHLLTGATTILNRHVEVPALRADGTELAIDLHVTRETAGGGRSVFIATLCPLETPAAVGRDDGV